MRQATSLHHAASQLIPAAQVHSWGGSGDILAANACSGAALARLLALLLLGEEAVERLDPCLPSLAFSVSFS